MEEQRGDAEVRLEVYRWFLDRGRPPVPAEIAESMDLPQGAVEDSLRRLAAGHGLVLAQGSTYIWMANPFSAIPTAFSVEADGRSWFGNCIWDALGIMAIVGGSGTVRTWCPDCHKRLSVEVDGGRLVSDEGVVHFVVPAAHWWDDIGFT